MTRPGRLWPGRSARHRVSYVCAFPGHESRPGHALAPFRYERWRDAGQQPQCHRRQWVSLSGIQSATWYADTAAICRPFDRRRQQEYTGCQSIKGLPAAQDRMLVTLAVQFRFSLAAFLLPTVNSQWRYVKELHLYPSWPWEKPIQRDDPLAHLVGYKTSSWGEHCRNRFKYLRS